MTPQHHALYAHHLDTARLMANATEPFFWVLDLDDPLGFTIAEAVDRNHARLCDQRETIRGQGAIPALTILTTLEAGNTMLRHGWQKDPLPEGRKYLAIVSAGRLSVANLT